MIEDLTVSSETIGEAWLEIARRILSQGAASRYDNLRVLEVPRVTITVAEPRTSDPIVREFGDSERLAWMHANFTDHSLVRELGDARSYASRLFDYAGTGRDQIDWVISRLRTDPTSRSATITTFEPLIDTTYIPCVSMLDFWLRDGSLEQVVYAHSIDFGSKGYGNLVELAWLQEHIASELGVPVGRLDFVIKSAHVYDSELSYMRSVLARVDQLG
ncbi:MAG TPA: thymidylate synthase [Galbitalea sp.]|nr:thymidylate synthase [Galbitalea sp.]